MGFRPKLGWTLVDPIEVNRCAIVFVPTDEPGGNLITSAKRVWDDHCHTRHAPCTELGLSPARQAAPLPRGPAALSQGGVYCGAFCWAVHVTNHFGEIAQLLRAGRQR